MPTNPFDVTPRNLCNRCLDNGKAYPRADRNASQLACSHVCFTCMLQMDAGNGWSHAAAPAAGRAAHRACVQVCRRVPHQAGPADGVDSSLWYTPGTSSAACCMCMGCVLPCCTECIHPSNSMPPPLCPLVRQLVLLLTRMVCMHVCGPVAVGQPARAAGPVLLPAAAR